MDARKNSLDTPTADRDVVIEGYGVIEGGKQTLARAPTRGRG